MRDFENLLERLTELKPGGFTAQKIYAPLGRLRLVEDEISKRNPNRAAVNILLYPKNGKWFFPLIQRTTNKHDKHSGQISLPGGRYEEEDLSFEVTAKRETFEEVGVPVDEIRIIKKLSPIYIPPSNFYVEAFVSWTPKTPDFQLQKSEVKELIEMPLHSIFTLPEKPEKQILPSTQGVAVPVINYDKHIIWGATSMILSEFRDLIKKF